MFRFQKFTVEDDQSTMKVGTDAMILGAWTEVPDSGNILEIGCGCGVISLMLAQRTNADITAIDIHQPSVQQAEENFRNSQWRDRLKAIHLSLSEFSSSSDDKFDLLISNPPFFSDSLLSPEKSRNLARHDLALTHDEIIAASDKLLKPDGRLVLILPHRIDNIFLLKAISSELNLRRHLSIFTKEKDHYPVRVILDLSREKQSPVFREKLVIRMEEGKFTKDYLELTKDYHVFG